MAKRSFRADDRLTELIDRDASWGPLLFLRPERQKLLSPARVLLLAGLLGGFYGMLANVMLSLIAPAGTAGKPSVFLIPALLTAVCFVCAELSVVGAWNRRARLLSRRLGWAELTGRPLPPPHDDGQATE
jgi:hypothetical protein